MGEWWGWAGKCGWIFFVFFLLLLYSFFLFLFFVFPPPLLFPPLVLRRVGWAEGGAEGGAGGVRAAVVAEGAGTGARASDHDPASAAHAAARVETSPAGGAGPGSVVALEHGGLEVRVAAGVLHQVVAAHEALVAQRAAELLLARVRAVVASQLVRAGKLLGAVGPGAGERALTCAKEQEKDKVSVFQPFSPIFFLICHFHMSIQCNQTFT